MQRITGYTLQRLKAGVLWGTKVPAYARGMSEVKSTESLFKGKPKLTRVKGPNLKKQAKKEAHKDEWGSTGRVELNPKNLGKLISTGIVATAGIGLIGVAAYYISTYFYLKTYWPVSESIENNKAENMLLLATYYEQISIDHSKALTALERALAVLSKDDEFDSNTIAILDIRVRIGRCLVNLGKLDDAKDILNPAIKVLEGLRSKSATDTNDIEAQEATKKDVDMLIFEAANALGQVYTEAANAKEAKHIYGIGLQAVKRMKRELVLDFNSEDVASYTKYDTINCKEAQLTACIAKVYYMEHDYDTAEVLFKTTLTSVQWHKANIKLAPPVVSDIRAFKDDWACLDAYAMLYLAKIQIARDRISDALLWIEPARKITSEDHDKSSQRCINCEPDLLAQLGIIAEKQENKVMALYWYKAAYENARINFGDNPSKYLEHVERLERKK